MEAFADRFESEEAEPRKDESGEHELENDVRPWAHNQWGEALMLQAGSQGHQESKEPSAADSDEEMNDEVDDAGGSTRPESYAQQCSRPSSVGIQSGKADALRR